MSAQGSGVDWSGTPDFLFVGGDLSIDLVNTEMMEAGRLVDRIAGPAELAAWVAGSELGSGLDVPGVMEIPRPVFERVVSLRAALRTGFDEAVAGRELPSGTLELLNEVLREEPGSRLRADEDGRLERVSLIESSQLPRWLPWLVADAAANLLAGPALGQLRRCANHVCVLFFVDTSRNHSRRWCSMELCGNRSKVSAHHYRARGKSLG